MVNSRVPFKFSESDLKKLLNDPRSCMALKKCKRHISIHPSLLGNVLLAIRNSLNSLVTKFDAELDGIVLGYRKMKLLGGEGAILNDAAHIHVDIKAQFFVFKPDVGCTLIGIVKEKSPDHIGCLVHKVFNVSIPCINAVEEEIPVDIGQQVTFKVDEVDLSNTLPYIKGTLISVGENQIHCGSSGFMGELLVGKKKESDIEKYLLQKKKTENLKISHETEDITAAADLINSNLSSKFPVSILKKSDVSGIMSPSKRITFGDSISGDIMSEESEEDKKTKLKKFPLGLSHSDALKTNDDEKQLSSSVKQKGKEEKRNRELCGNDIKKTDNGKKTKDNKKSPTEGGAIDLQVIRKIKTENVEKEENETVSPKVKKKRLRNLDENYLDTTLNEPGIETKCKKNKDITLSHIEKHLKMGTKGVEDYEENKDNSQADEQTNVSCAESSLGNVTGSKKGKKKKDSSEKFSSPLANSTIIPGSFSYTPKSLKADLCAVFSPIGKTGAESSNEEKGLAISTPINKVAHKKNKSQKSPSPSELLKKIIKEKNAAGRTGSKAETQNRRSPTKPSIGLSKGSILTHPKQSLKTKAQESSSDSDTSSSEPPDDHSFQCFKEKLDKERCVASNSDSSSSEPSDLPSLKQMKEKAMKKVFKIKIQRSLSHQKPPDSASSSSDDPATSQLKLQRDKVKTKEKTSPTTLGALISNKQQNSRSEFESRGKKEKRKNRDSTGKKDEKKRKTSKSNSSANKSVLGQTESVTTASPKKKRKSYSESNDSSKQPKKKKSKTKDMSTEKATALDADSAKVAALAEMLLKNLTG